MGLGKNNSQNDPMQNFSPQAFMNTNNSNQNVKLILMKQTNEFFLDF